MNDDQILSELRARYKRIKLELEKVKIAIRVFESNRLLNLPEDITESESPVPLRWDSRMPYKKKILYVLKYAEEPLYVNEIWASIDSLQPDVVKNRKTFQSAISQNLSLLTRENVIKSEWLNGKKKYALNI